MILFPTMATPKRKPNGFVFPGNNIIDGSRSMLEDINTSPVADVANGSNLHMHVATPQTPDLSAVSNPLIAPTSLISQVGSLMSQLNILIANLNATFPPNPNHAPSCATMDAKASMGAPVDISSTVSATVETKPDLGSVSAASNVSKGMPNVKHLPKFTEVISDDEAFRYLGIRSGKRSE